MIAEMYNTIIRMKYYSVASNIDEEIPIILEGTQRFCEKSLKI